MKYGLEKKARTVVEAATFGVCEAAKRADVSRKTVTTWRKELDTDEALRARVKELTAEDREAWRTEIQEAITAGVRFLGRAAGEADAKDPDVIGAVAAALTVLSDIAVTWRLVDARLAPAD